MLDVRVQKSLGNFSVDATFRSQIGVTALFGPSGAGKTSLVNMIAGLTRPDRGRISVDERVLFDADAGVDMKPERRGVGYVFQEGRLFPHMSVRANLLYGLRFAPRGARYAEPDRIVSLLGLEALLSRRPSTLSGGEKQRVAIGRALLAQPRLLLMDEPLAALDIERKREILGYVERLRDEVRVPIVYVSHSIEEVSRVADNLVLLESGSVVASGPISELMSRIDVRGLAGRQDAGALIESRVESHDETYGLTMLEFAGGTLRVPKLDATLGARVRVRIPARDVSVATERPQHISILNIFPGRIVEISEGGDGAVELRIDVGVPLRARVTARSAKDLDLAPGMEVFALVKSVSIERERVGMLASTENGQSDPVALTR